MNREERTTYNPENFNYFIDNFVLKNILWFNSVELLSSPKSRSKEYYSFDNSEPFPIYPSNTLCYQVSTRQILKSLRRDT